MICFAEVTVEEVLPPDRINLSLSDLDTPKAKRAQKQSTAAKPNGGKSLSLEPQSQHDDNQSQSKKQKKSKQQIVRDVSENEIPMDVVALSNTDNTQPDLPSVQPLQPRLKSPVIVNTMMRSPPNPTTPTAATKYVLVVPGVSTGGSPTARVVGESLTC